MRKFSAHRIYPVNQPPIAFGIIETADDGTILKIRPTGGKPVEEAGLEFYPGIIVPGFINTHCHLELSHLEGLIPEQTGISGFVSEVSRIRVAEDEIVVRAARQADREMYLNGISGAGDISNNGITLPIKQASHIRYHTFIELFGLDPEIAAGRFENALSLSSMFDQATEPHSLTPHAPYSVGSRLWELLTSATNLTSRISIHHDESQAERELLDHRTGILAKDFIQAGFDLTALPDEASDILRLLGRYLPGSDWILVHNTLTNPLAIAKPLKPGVSWVLCPLSNRYIENRLPDIHAFAASGLNVCIGTDSKASNRTLSVLEEMKTIQQEAPEVDFETVLKWATLNGARALGMEETLGSMEPGKKPGLVNIPLFDWPSNRLKSDSKPIRLI